MMTHRPYTPPAWQSKPLAAFVAVEKISKEKEND